MRSFIAISLLSVTVVVGCTTRPPRAFEAIPDAEAMHLRAEARVEGGEVASAGEEEFIATAVDELPEALPQKGVDELRFHSIPVGAGSCHLIECPGNTSPIIYDCGTIGETSNSFSEDQVAGYFGEILDLYDEAPIVIVSHADQDHYNHIPEAMGVTASSSGRAAKVIYLGGVRTKYDEDGFDNWLDDQEQRGVRVEVGLARFPPFFNNNGQPVADLQCGDAETFIMSVNTGFNTNPRSMVVRIVYDDFVLTLAGDAFEITEDRAAQFPGGARTTVLTGSHHGASSHDSNHREWAMATKPEVTIFSAGGKFRHPRCSSMLNYKSSLATVNPHRIRCGRTFPAVYTGQFFVDRAEYVTEVSGVVTVTTDGQDYEIECSAEPDCG